MKQISMREHDAFGSAGRAAGVLQKGEGTAVDRRTIPSIGPLGLDFSVHFPYESFKGRSVGSKSVESIEYITGCECHRSVGI